MPNMQAVLQSALCASVALRVLSDSEANDTLRAHARSLARCINSGEQARKDALCTLSVALDGFFLHNFEKCAGSARAAQMALEFCTDGEVWSAVDALDSVVDGL